jgi:DnaJ-class molecular chaperone
MRWRLRAMRRARLHGAADCARTCSTCGGMGKVRAQQGFFVVERGCPTCRGSGEIVADPCRACEGEGRALSKRKLTVKIPAGVDEGTRIRVAGEGEAGVRNGPSGDLYIFVHMKRHPVYAREGTTLIADCPVSFTTAALGGSITLAGLDGEEVEVKIPAGVQSGEQLRQRGSGMSVLNGRGRGDLVARILVETPTKMSAKQKKLLQPSSARPKPATNARRRRISSPRQGDVRGLVSRKVRTPLRSSPNFRGGSMKIRLFVALIAASAAPAAAPAAGHLRRRNQGRKTRARRCRAVRPGRQYRPVLRRRTAMC